MFVYVWLSDGLNIVRHFLVGLEYFVYFLRRHFDCICGNKIEKNLCTEETVHLYTTEKNRRSKQERTTEKLTIARTSFIFIHAIGCNQKKELRCKYNFIDVICVAFFFSGRHFQLWNKLHTNKRQVLKNWAL